MDEKLEMFLDADEQENLLALVNGYAKNSKVMSSGSMTVIWNTDVEAYEVYVLRGYFKAKPPE